MKSTKSIIPFLALLLLISSCKKEEDNPTPSTDFDINNPVGYCIFLKSNLKETTNGNTLYYNEFALYEFLADNQIRVRKTAGGIVHTYEITNQNQITIQNVRFTFYANNVVDVVHTPFPNSNYMVEGATAELIQIPDTNQLAGKTFEGTLHNGTNGTMFGSYSYRFDETNFYGGPDINNPDFSFPYEVVLNIALFNMDIDHQEYLVLNNNGQLEVEGNTFSPFEYFKGTFTEQ